MHRVLEFLSYCPGKLDLLTATQDDRGKYITLSYFVKKSSGHRKLYMVTELQKDVALKPSPPPPKPKVLYYFNVNSMSEHSILFRY